VSRVQRHNSTIETDTGAAGGSAGNTGGALLSPTDLLDRLAKSGTGKSKIDTAKATLKSLGPATTAAELIYALEKNGMAPGTIVKARDLISKG